jgi:hypothetical protein
MTIPWQNAATISNTAAFFFGCTTQTFVGCIHYLSDTGWCLNRSYLYVNSLGDDFI